MVLWKYSSTLPLPLLFRPANMGRPQEPSTSINAAVVDIQSNEQLKEKPRKWYYYLWDTLDKPKEERWFMFKLDAALLTFASLGMINTVCGAPFFILIHRRIFYQVSRSEQHQ
jgi:hypothetical protein